MRTTDRLRFDVALYTVADAARIVDVHPSTLATWAKGYRRSPRDGRPVVGPPIVAATTAGRRGEPTIPFVGLAEALVLAAVRRIGVPMQRIRPALDALKEEIGVEHALASRRLFTSDGGGVALRDAPILVRRMSPRSSVPRSTKLRTSSVSHPAGLPDLFLDRSLGRIKVPGLPPQI